MQTDLDASYNSRQCIIDHESRDAGMYSAENNISSASGAYQWLNSSWRNYLSWTEEYYGFSLISPDENSHGARNHAGYASPYAQDLVSAFALAHRNLAQNQRPWPYSSCWYMLGTNKSLRPDGPENEPTPYILSQIGMP